MNKAPLIVAAVFAATIACKHGKGGAGAEKEADGIAVAYQLNPAHSGSLTDPAFHLPLTPAWSALLASDPSYPILADGAVYVAFANAGAIEAKAFDAHTGAPLWGPVNLQTGERATLAYNHGTLFVHTSAGWLHALEGKTGKFSWSAQITLNGDDVFHDSYPVASEGRVYVADAKSALGQLWSINWDGKDVFGASIMSPSTTSAPAIVDGTAFLTFIESGAAAIDLTKLTGFQSQDLREEDRYAATVWNQRCACSGGGVGFVPAVYEGKLYERSVFGNSTIRQTSDGLPTGEFPGTLIPAFSNDMGFGMDSDEVIAFNIETRARAWSKGAPSKPKGGSSAFITPALAINGIVFAVTRDGTVIALEGATGDQLWSGELEKAVSQPSAAAYGLDSTGMAAGEGMLIIPTQKGIFAFASGDATADAGTSDAGTLDAGTSDAGTPDAGTPDAGTPDAGP